MNCPYCGTANDPSNQFCLACGKPMSNTPVANLTVESSSRSMLWIVAGRLVGALLLLWLLRAVLIDLDFVKNTIIPEVNLPMTTVITIGVGLTILLLVIGFITALAQLWPASFPAYSEAAVIFNTLLWLIVLNQIYRIVVAVQPLVTNDREILTITGVTLVVAALVLAIRAFVVTYQVLPRWLSSWRMNLATTVTPQTPH